MHVCVRESACITWECVGPTSTNVDFSNGTNSGECLTERAHSSLFAYLQVIDRRFTSSINRHLDTSTKVYMELNGYLWPLIPPDSDILGMTFELTSLSFMSHINRYTSKKTSRWCGVVCMLQLSIPTETGLALGGGAERSLGINWPCGACCAVSHRLSGASQDRREGLNEL